MHTKLAGALNPLRWNWSLQLIFTYYLVSWAPAAVKVFQVIPITWGTPEFYLISIPGLVSLAAFTCGVYVASAAITYLQPAFMKSLWLRTSFSLVALSALWVGPTALYLGQHVGPLAANRQRITVKNIINSTCASEPLGNECQSLARTYPLSFRASLLSNFGVARAPASSENFD
ncbi:MAG: hypothetical protein JST16_06670 [Bdellovibrionales bacterium]|nr:hypothetical protein [Bdellovibrionales bacterium]